VPNPFDEEYVMGLCICIVMFAVLAAWTSPWFVEMVS